MSKISAIFEELPTDVVLELESLQLLQASEHIPKEELAEVERITHPYQVVLGTLNEEIQIARRLPLPSHRP